MLGISYRGATKDFLIMINQNLLGALFLFEMNLANNKTSCLPVNETRDEVNAKVEIWRQQSKEKFLINSL